MRRDGGFLFFCFLAVSWGCKLALTPAYRTAAGFPVDRLAALIAPPDGIIAFGIGESMDLHHSTPVSTPLAKFKTPAAPHCIWGPPWVGSRFSQILFSSYF